MVSKLQPLNFLCALVSNWHPIVIQRCYNAAAAAACQERVGLSDLDKRGLRHHCLASLPVCINKIALACSDMHRALLQVTGVLRLDLHAAALYCRERHSSKPFTSTSSPPQSPHTYTHLDKCCHRAAQPSPAVCVEWSACQAVHHPPGRLSRQGVTHSGNNNTLKLNSS